MMLSFTAATDYEGNIFGEELRKIGWKGTEPVGKESFIVIMNFILNKALFSKKRILILEL